MSSFPFVILSEELEGAGLIWQPEIGDEIAPRVRKDTVSILVDPDGMTPKELRTTYIWLPSAEQIIHQFEIRQAILFHAGLEISQERLCYKTVVRSSGNIIESYGENFRTSLGIALKNLLRGDQAEPMH